MVVTTCRPSGDTWDMNPTRTLPFSVPPAEKAGARVGDVVLAWNGKKLEDANELPRLVAKQPDVIMVGGDHSTPALLAGHSWHPVPVALWAKWGRPDGVREFSERACAGGGLGRMRGIHLMPILVAHALGLEKYGA